jgi:hypothetical protein
MADQNAQLKQLIKKYVRESLMEIFAEMKLETIVENAVRKEVSKRPESTRAAVIPEAVQRPVRPAPKAPAAPSRREIMERLGIDESTWQTYYADTEADPIVTGEASDVGVEVSESALDRLGVFDKDWSAFVK